MNPGPVAVIDVGSNSIKVLVAARTVSGGIATLHARALDARISAGLGRAQPRLSEPGMARGLEAVRTLREEASRHSPTAVCLVGTSAVRDAANGREFCDRLREATGVEPRLLSGEEEARLIGRGLCCDPALRQARDFRLFDLGGGSLECLEFGNRDVRQSLSVPLGCVRLTERFVSDPEAPFPPAAAEAIAAHVRATLARGGYRFSPGEPGLAVATGGTVTTVRAILGARAGVPLEDVPPVIPVDRLRELLGDLGAMPLAHRRGVPGLPPARADVFPTALATLAAIAELGGFASFTHSFYNLRYGLAADMLGID